MKIKCSYCDNFQIFPKNADGKDFRQAGFFIVGINIKENEEYFKCQSCLEKKRIDNTGKIF